MAAIATSPGRGRPAGPDEPIWRLSVAEYHDMIRTGIIKSGDPVELLEGWLVAKMAKNPPHSSVTGRLQDVLGPLVAGRACLRVQGHVTLDDSEPEPDAALARGSRDRYDDRHPAPADLVLVVEVADSPVPRDRGLKKRVYARAGVGEYWIVNIPERRVEVYTLPGGTDAEPDYERRQDYAADGAVPLVIDGTAVGTVPVGVVLPPARG